MMELGVSTVGILELGRGGGVTHDNCEFLLSFGDVTSPVTFWGCCKVGVGSTALAAPEDERCCDCCGGSGGSY